MNLPSLRQRREDIPMLETHFLKELCQANGKPMKTLTRPALTLLAALPWRGNLPELKGLLERLVLLVPQGLIRLEDVLTHTHLDGSVSTVRVDATLRQARARFENSVHAPPSAAAPARPGLPTPPGSWGSNGPGGSQNAPAKPDAPPRWRVMYLSRDLDYREPHRRAGGPAVDCGPGGRLFS